MSENWIVIEQQARDRIAEARAAARARALAKLAHPARPGAVGLVHLVRHVMARTITRTFERSRGLGSPRAAAKRC